jgi:hypothetical protein
LRPAEIILPAEAAAVRELLGSRRCQSADSSAKTEIRALTSAATWPFDPFHFERRATPEIELNGQTKCGGEQLIRVVVTRATFDKVAPKIRPTDDVKPEAVYEDLTLRKTRHRTFKSIATRCVTVKICALPAITAFRLLAAKLKWLRE